MTRRRLIFALAVLVLVYGGAWLYAAGAMGDAIDRWAGDRRAEGWTISYRPVVITGFPFALRARIEAPRIARDAAGAAGAADAAGAGPAWRGPTMTAAFKLWDLRRIEFSAPGAHHFDYGPAAGRRQATLRAEDAAATLALDERGRAQQLAVRLARIGFQPRRDGPQTAARALALTFAAPAVPTDPADQPHLRPSLRVTAEIAHMDLPAGTRAPLGRRIESLVLTAVIKGRLAKGPLAQALDAWRRDGGVIEVERLELNWAALGLDADGTVALDANLQPMGALTARIAGFSETVEALVAAGAVRPRDGLTAKIVLGLLARTPEGGGRPRITAPLSLRDRRLRIGPVPLLRLPAIRWD